MKNVIKMVVLVAGLACALSAFAAPIVPAQEDGAPTPLHPPTGLVSMIS
jgi:hypothetical protein